MKNSTKKNTALAATLKNQKHAIDASNAKVKAKGAKTAAPAKKGAKSATPAAKTAAPKKGAKTAAPAAPAARETNKSRAIAMLTAGTTQAELMSTFGWLPHTTRGFVSVTGNRYVIESKAVDGVRHYKITGERK